MVRRTLATSSQLRCPPEVSGHKHLRVARWTYIIRPSHCTVTGGCEKSGCTNSDAKGLLESADVAYAVTGAHSLGQGGQR